MSIKKDVSDTEVENTFSFSEKKKYSLAILRRLKKAYPHPGPFAEWENPLQLVVVTMLSAQCTDERVNRVSKPLFQKYKTAEDFSRAHISDLEKMVYSTGYYKSKTRYLKGIGKILCEKFHGEVPKAFDDLLALPGISKKSACIIGAKAFGKFYGIPVDTHVLRLVPRWGLIENVSRDIMARELEKLFPRKEYLAVNEYAITHGRAVCTPRNPKCGECVLGDVCLRMGIEN